MSLPFLIILPSAGLQHESEIHTHPCPEQVKRTMVTQLCPNFTSYMSLASRESGDHTTVYRLLTYRVDLMNFNLPCNGETGELSEHTRDASIR